MTSRWQVAEDLPLATCHLPPADYEAFNCAETIPDIGENAKPAHRFAVQQRLLSRLSLAYSMRLCANHSVYATMAAFGCVASRQVAIR